MINEIVAPLAELNIDIHELTTSATTITVFVRRADREQAEEAIQRSMDRLV